MSTLRMRCAEFLMMLAIPRQAVTPVDDLTAFVVAETGRKADANLDQSLPLCLYFPSIADREDFIRAFLEAKPHAVVKKLP